MDNPMWRNWGTLLRSIVGGLFSPHFVLSVLIIASWVHLLLTPIGTWNSFNAQIASGNLDAIKTAKDTIPFLQQAVLVVSGLFTTFLGLVLGHYFGQHGEATRVSEQREETQRVTAVLLSGANEDKSALAEAAMTNREQSAALEELLELLAQAGTTIKIRTDGPLAHYL